MTDCAIADLSKEYNVCLSTLRVCLGRSEFSHLKIGRGIVKDFTEQDRQLLEQLLLRKGLLKMPKRKKRSKTAILKDKAEQQMKDVVKLRALKPLSQEERDLLDYYKKQYEGAKGLLTCQGKTILLAFERIEQLEKRVEELEQGLCND